MGVHLYGAGFILFLLTVLSLLILRGAINPFSYAVERPHMAGSLDKIVGLLMRVLVSLAVLTSALFVILSRHFDADQQKWAFGSIGTILGYWLKG